MGMIPKQYKMELGELLAKWYRRYGKVAPRKPYFEDDTSDSGGSELLFETHPLLSEVPIGAPSDLECIILADNRTLYEADKRSDEASPELRNQLEMALQNRKQPKFNPLNIPK